MKQQASGEDLFCRIIRGELPEFRVAEDEAHIALMDIYPPTFDGVIRYPVVLTMPKLHLPPDIMDLPREHYVPLARFTHDVARAAKRALDAYRVMHIDEGMEVAHAHSKLYVVRDRADYPGWIESRKSEMNKGIRAPDEWLAEQGTLIKAVYDRWT